MSITQKQLGRFGTKKDTYPTKTSINLIEQHQPESRGLEILLSLAFLVLLALFVKFAVVDPLAGSIDSSNKVALAQQELDTLKEQNKALAASTEEYYDYVVHGLTEEEQNLTNRNDIIDLIEKKVMDVAYLSSVEVSGNVISAVCLGVDLQGVSGIVQDLESDERVAYVTVSTAKETDEKNTSATIQITMKGALEQSLSSEEGVTNDN